MSHTAPPSGGCPGGCPLVSGSTGLQGLAPAGVDRRAFLSQAVLATAYAAAAAALAACGSGGGGDPTSPSSIGTSISLASYPSLATVGGVATMTLGSTPFAVVRTGASSFVALSRICPHRGTTVDVVSGGFHCPNHGAQFSSTGQWTGGQPTSNMASYPTTYDAAAGTLQVG